jgi:hypothetical protein
VDERTLADADPAPPATRTDARPVVLTCGWRYGERISRVLRPDGTAFTVTVPRLGLSEHNQLTAAVRPWISEDTGRSELSDRGALSLAAAAGLSQLGRRLIDS